MITENAAAKRSEHSSPQLIEKSAFPAESPPFPDGIRPWLRDLMLLAAAAGMTVLILFVFWESFEHFFATSDSHAHLIHYARGISSSLIAAVVVGWLSYRLHRGQAAQLEDEVRKRTREAQEASTFLQLVVDTTPASLVVLDKQLRIVKANKTAERVHGTKLEGLHCFESLAGRPEKCPDCMADLAHTSGPSSCNSSEHRVSRTGEVLNVEAHSLKLPDGKDYLLLVEQVVTEQKKMQARLLHQEKMAAFGLLAAGIAHDIGNPLSSITTQLQLLDQESLSADAAPILSTVRQELDRLGRTVRELTGFARRRGEGASLVSVQSVAKVAFSLFRHDKRMQSVQTIEDFDPDTPPVHMIEDHLMQVILNLLINALLGMPHGGTLRLGLRPVSERVELRIQDTGVGMEPSVLKRCLEPFFTTRDRGNGTGLGLSISKDIVQAAGGDIEVQSVPGQGTTVIVTLPGASPEATDHSSLSQSAAPIGADAGRVL